MNIWDKLIVGIKVIFCGFESATDYLFKLLNNWLSDPDIAVKVETYYGKAVSVYSFLVKYQRFCPAAWMDAYKETLVAVKNLIDVFADGKVEQKEIQDAIEGFKKAYEAWLKD